MTEGKQKIGLRFVQFKTLHFWMQPPVQEPAEGKVDFMVNAGGGIIENVRNRLALLIKVSVHIKDGEAGKLRIGEIETESIFELEGIEIGFGSDGKLNVPEQVMITFLSLAVSTTRGALSTRGAGTSLERFVLPIMNPKDLLKTAEAGSTGQESM